MGIGERLSNAGRALFASGDEAKAYTLLSPDDIKANVPQFNMQGGGASSVPIYSSMAEWDNAIDRALSGWRGSKINYAAEVGDLRLSVLLMAAVHWAGINLAQGRLKVVELDADRKETELPDHRFTTLFDEPNPEVEIDTLWKQFAASWILYGEVCFLLSRDNAGRIIELWWEPYWTIKPKWDRVAFPNDKTANTSIQYFEILRDGQWSPWRKADVFRIYDGFDPITRRGMNGVQALLRTIFTDYQREQYTALLLKNCGVSPMAVAPKEANTNIKVEDLSAALQRRTSGDEQGKPTVFNQPMEVLNFATDYSQEAMEKIAHISESRVAAALGISAQSLKFMVSQLSSTYNNVREFRREDFEQWVMPTQESFRKAARRQLLRAMDSDKRHDLRFDYSEVAVVQRDRLQVAKETDMLVRARVINQEEARERHDYKPVSESQFNDEPAWFPVPANTTTAERIDDSGMPLGETLADAGGSARPN